MLPAGTKCEFSTSITTSQMLPKEFDEFLTFSQKSAFTKTLSPAAKEEKLIDKKSTSNKNEVSDKETSKENDSTHSKDHSDIKNDLKKEMRAAQKESRKIGRYGNK